jgi:type IV secretory pathway VirB2 component (pilin)
VTAAVVTATAVFALAGIGTPLLGLSVFADTASLIDYSGYRDVLAGTEVQHTYHRDLVDSAMPNSILFGEAIRSGEFPAWNPYALGGAPLGGTPNLAVASPVSLPWWIMPGWLAPAYMKLLELVCAVGGTFLFLRRLRLGRASSWLGGLAFASSAFMVAWTGWPQTRVACLIPALFWALERLVQRVGATEVALVSLPVAGMLLGGFPAVTGYALLTAVMYLLVRVLARRRRSWRPVAARLAAATAALVAGVGLAAWQLVPWVRYMGSVLVAGRTQNPGEHIPVEALLTAIAPYAFGTVNAAYPPDWFGPLELVDAESYVGSATAVLVVAAVALPGIGRRLLPRGVWWFFVGSSAFWVAAVYFGGPLLWLLQRTSFLFSDNFVGRARSVLGFLLAVLAAAGFEAVLRRRAPRMAPAGVRPASAGQRRSAALRPPWVARAQQLATRALPRQAYGLVIWTVVVTGIALLYVAGRRAAARADMRAAADSATAATATGREDATAVHLGYLNGQVAAGVAVMAVAAACAAWLWFGRRSAGGWRRHATTVAAAALPLLIAAQALWWVQTYHPRTDRETFYPRTPTQEYLAAHLGHERFFGADGAIFGSVDVTAHLRSYHGHGFIERGYASVADTLPGEQFLSPTTAITADPDFAAKVAVSPVLDRAAVTHFVAPPEIAPFGHTYAEPDDGTTVDLMPGEPVSVRVPVIGPLRGVGVTPVASAAGPVDGHLPAVGPPPAHSPQTSAHLRVVLRDAAGRIITTGERRPKGKLQSGQLRPGQIDEGQLTGGVPWFVPLAAEDLASDAAVTAELTASGQTPLRVAAVGGRPAISVVSTAADGLRMVYAAESVIYERTRALDRARWASSIRVEPDPDLRLRLLASGSLRPDEVLLAGAGSAAEGAPATVTWIDDGLDEMVLSVRADGAGYLVLADAIQTGWRVTVDGDPATLVAADHGFAAVAVPAGEHTVRFFYPGPLRGPGAWITGLTVLVLLGAVGAVGARRPHLPRLVGRRLHTLHHL